MASSLPSVVAISPPLSFCPAGLLSSSRSFGASSSFSLLSRVVCRHNVVRVFWRGFVSGGGRTTKAKVASSGDGLVNNVEETKPRPRRRVKKSVKEVDGSATGPLPNDIFATDALEVITHEHLQKEEAQSSNSQSVPSVKKKSSKKRGAEKVGKEKGQGMQQEANGTVVAFERRKTDDSESQGEIDGTVERADTGAPLELVEDVEAIETRAASSAGGSVKRRGGRSRRVKESPKSDNSSAERIEITGVDEENTQIDVGSLIDNESDNRRAPAPLRSRTRRKKKGSVPGQEGATNGSVAATEGSHLSTMDELEGVKMIREGSDTLLSLVSNDGNVDIHVNLIGSPHGQEFRSGSDLEEIPVMENGEKAGKPRKRKKRGKVVSGEIPVGDGDLGSGVQETKVSSLCELEDINLSAGMSVNGSSAREGAQDEDHAKSVPDSMPGLEGSASTEDEIVNDGQRNGNAAFGVQNNKSGGEVKKKRQRRAKRKPLVVTSSEDSRQKENEVDEFVVAIEITSSESEVVSSVEVGSPVTDATEGFRQHVKDDAEGSDVPSDDNYGASVLSSSEQGEAADSTGAGGETLPKISDSKKRRARRRRQSGRSTKTGLHAVEDGGEPFGSKEIVLGVDLVNADDNGRAADNLDPDFHEGKVAVETDVGTGIDIRNDEVKLGSKLRFPAPTWGPQWWEEIQTKSQATISFQEVTEWKEGTQARSPEGDQDPVGDEKVKSRKETKRRSDKKEEDSGLDLVSLNRGGIASHGHETSDKSGKGGAKAWVSENMIQESRDEWLKKKMRRMVRPTEEPWLLESMILAQTEQAQLLRKQEAVEGPQPHEDLTLEVLTGSESSSTEARDVKREPDMEVEILINSSECTMQRMAILENKKLVEFSIEPVITKVQVGNVYLGRVKQLLPGMSGVFVDIGGPRLALLDIARNQYPYTFPPIAGSESRSNSSSLDEEEALHLPVEDDDDEEDDYEEDEEEDEEDEEELRKKVEEDGTHESDDGSPEREGKIKKILTGWRPHERGSPITVNFGRKFSKWRTVEEGMPIIVQVKKEAMGKKGPRLTAFPTLAGRFWVLIPRGSTVGVSARITGPERRRLKLIAQGLQPQDLGITVRTEAIGHEQEELEKDLARLMDIWKDIMEKAAAAALAVESGEEAAVPVLLHREMGQTLTIIRDFFTDKVSRLVVDSSQSYQEVITYLHEVAPHLMSRVVLYSGKVPIFDVFNVEADLEKFSSERVKLPNGGYLVMQETEALVSIDVNGGSSMLGHSTRQREAILEVNIAAARQIASEIRLRDIGGIIVVDFIDMDNDNDEKLVHEEMRKAIQRDRSKVAISEISEFGLMEMTRKRVRPSVTLTMNDPCFTCKGTGRVEALETTLSKIERAIRRLLAERPDRGEVSSGATKWPQILLRIEPSMLEYLKSWKKKRIIQLSNSLKVWITLKMAMELSRGQFQVIEVLRTVSEKQIGGVPSGPQVNLQQQKAGSTPLLGKRMLPKRRRFFSK